jgi:hypothetical protein
MPRHIRKGKGKCNRECEPKVETNEIKEIHLRSKKGCKKIVALTADKPDCIDRLQTDSKIYATRMWIAKANQDLDGCPQSYAESYDELEGSYLPSQQRVVGFHKGFTHDQFGELTVDGAEPGLPNYKTFVCGIMEQDVKKIATQVKGFGGSNLNYAGVFDSMNGTIAGMAATSVELPKAYREFSNEGCAEMVENYLMNLNLDVPFCEYESLLAAPGTNPLKLAKEILEKPVVNQYLLNRSAVSGVYTAQNIFRGNNSGAQKGPYVSQLFLTNIAAGATNTPGVTSWKRVQKYNTGKPLAQTSSAVSWAFTSGQAGALLNGRTAELHVGGQATATTSLADTELKFIYSGRSLATYVQEEPRAQAAYDSALILGSWGLSFNIGLGGEYNNQRDNNTNAHPASPQTLAAILSNVNNTLAYYWKYFRNRRVRPEAMGLYVHNQMTGAKNYHFPAWFIARNGVLKALWDAVVADNAAIADKYANQANLSPDPRVEPSYTYHVQTRGGNPRHPSYPAGHSAAISGIFACKFFYNTDVALSSLNVFRLNASGAVSAVLADDADLDYSAIGGKDASNSGKAIYLEPNQDGSKLVVKFNTDPTWTVGDEIDKMASHVAHGRDWIGVHFRIDDDLCLKYCEESVLRFLKDHISIWGQNEIRVVNGEVVEERQPEVPYTKYNGEKVIISPHFCD